MHSPLKKLLTMKGTTVESVAPTDTVQDAVVSMNEKGIGAVLVKDGTRPVGIFTERDVLKRVVALGRDAAATPVFEVMTRELVAVKPSVTVEDAMAVVTQKRCRHLPVVDKGEVVGMVSIGNLTKWATRDREVHIQQLVDFITGKYPA